MFYKVDVTSIARKLRVQAEVNTIRLSRIQLKFREISSCFILETDFRFEFLVRKYACAENFKLIKACPRSKAS